MRHDLTLEMGGAGGEFSPRGAARRRTSAHSGGGAAGESHQLVAAVIAHATWTDARDGGRGGRVLPSACGAARRRTSAHSGGGAAGESHQLVAARLIAPAT